MTTNDDPATDPARVGLEHLQAAAHEMISAARSMLDAVEELLDDPRTAASLTTAITTVGRVIEGAVASVTDVVTGARGEHGEHDDSHVQRIKVS
jgi:hypothetical protein